MFLSKQSITEAVMEGEIYISTAPDTKAKLEAWCKRSIKGCSLDLHLGKEVAYLPRVSSPSQQVQFAEEAALIDTARPPDTYFKTRILDGAGTLEGFQRILMLSEEFLTLSESIAAQLKTRSTAARWGLDFCGSSNFIQPGYAGNITFEVHNRNQAPIRLYPGESYASLLFCRLDGSVDDYICSYANAEPEPGEAIQPSVMLPKTIGKLK